MDFREQIKTQALQAPDQEVCGLVVGLGRRDFCVIPKTNVSSSPKNSFVISPTDFLDVKNIKYIYHSHPKSSSAPSRIDRLYCSELQIPFVIYSVPDDDFYTLTPRRYTPPWKGV